RGHVKLMDLRSAGALLNRNPFPTRRSSDLRAKDGDARALEALCARHADRVQRIALNVLHDPDDASDAAQEALVKLVRRVHQFRRSEEHTSELQSLAYLVCRLRLEKQKMTRR